MLPTPGASVLVRRFGFDLAAVVSASHNPYEDNGIKFFGPEGTKLDDAQEAEIERVLGPRRPARWVACASCRGARHDYLRELELRFAELDLSRPAGAARLRQRRPHLVAPEIFRRLGADVNARGGARRAQHLPASCGSTHVERLGERMDGHDIGFAFDGDGDRVLAVDRNGEVVDGDELMALAASTCASAGCRAMAWR